MFQWPCHIAEGFRARGLCEAPPWVFALIIVLAGPSDITDKVPNAGVDIVVRAVAAVVGGYRHGSNGDNMADVPLTRVVRANWRGLSPQCFYRLIVGHVYVHRFTTYCSSSLPKRWCVLPDGRSLSNRCLLSVSPCPPATMMVDHRVLPVLRISTRTACDSRERRRCLCTARSSSTTRAQSRREYVGQWCT